MKNPIFAKTVSAKTVTIGARSLRNHNKLLWRLEGADGVKTGYTRAAGRILVSSAVREGRRLIAVTINDGNDWVDHVTMHNDGFSNYTPQKIIKKGQKLGTIAVFGGEVEYVSVLAADDFSLSISEQEQPYVLLGAPDFSYAPVVEGQAAGTAYICIGDQAVGQVPLIYETTVEQFTPQRKSFWSRWFGGKNS